MPGQSLSQIMGGVLARRSLEGVLVVLPQHGAVIRVSAVFDKQLCPLVGGPPAQVCYALLCDHHGHVMLRLVHMGHHGHDAGDESALGHGLGGKDADAGIAGKVTAAAQAIHHLGAHDVGGVDIAVDIHLNGGIEGDDAQTADDLRMVGDLIGANDDLVVEGVDVLIKAFAAVPGQGHGAGGDELEHTLLNEAEGGVLHNLRVHAQAPETAGGQAAQNRVAHGAHAGLDGARILGQAAGGDLTLEELDHVLADLLCGGCDGLELLRRLLLVGHDDGRDLLRRAGHKGRADAVVGLGNGNDPGMGRQPHLKDVVHPHKAHGQSLVDLHDDLVGVAYSGISRTAGGAEVQALLRHSGALHNGHIDVQARPLIHIRGQVGDMNVAEEHRAVVDGLAQIAIGLVTKPAGDQASPDQGTVDLVTHGSTHADGQISCVAGGCQGFGYSLGVADAGKAADGHHHAGLDELSRLLGGHQFILQR